MKATRGFSTLECLVSLVIAGIALGMLLPALTMSLQTSRRLQQAETTRASTEKVFAEIQTNLECSQTFRALPNFRLHPLGKIVDADGTTLTFSAKTRPDPRSNAISFLQPDELQILRVLETSDLRSKSAKAVLCSQLQGASPGISSSDETRFLAQSVDGFVEVDGRLERFGAPTSDCPRRYRGTISLVTGPFFDYLPNDPKLTREDILGHVVQLIGVKDEFTFYLDESGTLRRLSQTTSENAPLTYGLESIEFKLRKQSAAMNWLQVDVSTDGSFSDPTPVHIELPARAFNATDLTELLL